jgi:hypothetical protein
MHECLFGSATSQISGKPFIRGSLSCIKLGREKAVRYAPDHLRHLAKRISRAHCSPPAPLAIHRKKRLLEEERLQHRAGQPSAVGLASTSRINRLLIYITVSTHRNVRRALPRTPKPTRKRPAERTAATMFGANLSSTPRYRSSQPNAWRTTVPDSRGTTYSKLSG